MLLGLQNVTFEFGARVIVKDATWHIQPNERIGLIGYNGTGKSTILKVLTNQYLPSAGTVEKGKETTIGFLHQDLLSFDTDDSIFEVALSAFEKVQQLEKEIEQIGIELEKTSDESLAITYGDKLHELEVLGGYDIHHKTEEILQGLGFANADLQRPYKEFSGGWRMRVLLAKMILMNPDVLLLDEPTNHLDLPSIEWLEKYLQHYKGSVVIVSHDRYFISKTANKIWHIEEGKIREFIGTYDEWAVFEQERQKRQVAAQQPVPDDDRGSEAGRVPVDRGGAGRVPQGRRQREVPDATARRRGGGRVEAGWRAGSVSDRRAGSERRDDPQIAPRTQITEPRQGRCLPGF